MKITDRIKAIAEVEDAHWDSQRNRLIIYHHKNVDTDTVRIKVAQAIRDASLENAVEEITLISL